MTFVSGPNRIADSTSSRVESGHVKIEYTEQYQLISNSVGTDSTLEATFASGVPVYGQVFATSLGVNVWVARKSCVRSSEAERVKYIVTVNYTNDTEGLPLDEQGQFAQDVEDIAKTIRVASEQQSEIATDAVYLETTRADGTVINDGPLIKKGQVGIVSTSAGEPKSVPVFRSSVVLTIQDFKRTWDNAWHDYENTINSKSVTITQSDVDGQRYTRTFEPATLLCQSVEKNDVFRDGKLYFRRRIVLRHRESTWYHRQEDVGTVQYFTGGFSAFNLKNENGSEDDTAAGSPQKLNGAGKFQPSENGTGQYDTGETFYLVYGLHDERDFGDLLE